MSKKKIPEKEIKVLWGKSGHLCAICRELLIQYRKDGSCNPIGEMAHIKGENPGSARYDATMTDIERCKYDNLILLCPTCHTKIDTDIDRYNVELLKQIKKEHEQWIMESLETGIINVTFAELDVTIKYFLSNPISDNDSSLTVIPPKEKIEKNELSSDIEYLINLGLTQVKQVKNYLNANMDRQFSERLRLGFVNKYTQLKEEGLKGDVLFHELLAFASNYSNDFTVRAAGLSVLVYYFELCEVFEK
jgi:hypothetical protein